MGWFSTKKKYYPFAVAERMLNDEDFRFSHQYAMTRYLAEQRLSDKVSFDDNNLIQHLIDTQRNALPRKYERVYRYAQLDNRYIFGLPKAELSFNPLAETKRAIQNYLNHKESSIIDITYLEIGNENLYHFVWFNLLEQYGYQFNTNELTVLSQEKQSTCYLYNADIYINQTYEQDYSENGILNPIGLTYTFGECFTRNQDINQVHQAVQLADKDYAVIWFKYLDSNQQEITESIEIDLSSLNPVYNDGDIMLPEWDYIQCLYQVNQEYKLFTYALGSNQLPDLENQLSFEQDTGEFYPRLYIRLHGQDIINLDESDIRRVHSNKAFKKLGLILKDTTKQIHGSLGEDLGSVHHIFINPALSINQDNDNVMVAEYFFKYFERLYRKSTPINESNPYIRQGLIQRIKDKEYHQILRFSQIERGITQGKASFSDGRLLEQGDYVVQKLKEVNFAGSGIRLAFKTYHRICYQVSDTEYISIVVRDLTLINEFSGYSTSASGDDVQLVIPLDRLLIKTLSPREKELIFNKALRVHISLVKVVKRKWYQRGAFKVVLAIIALVISYFSAGSGSAFSAKLLAMAYGTAVSVAVSIAIQILVKIAVKLGLDPKIAGVIAFIGAIIASMRGANFNMSQAFNAYNVMKAINVALDVYNKMLQMNLQKIQKEMQQFKEYAKSQDERLKQAQAMLNTGVIPLDLELLTSPYNALYINLGETPDEFYNRTMMVDVTYITQNIASYFVENTTALPNFNQLKRLGMRDDNDIESILLV